VQKIVLLRDKIKSDIEEEQARIQRDAIVDEGATISLKKALQAENIHFQQLESKIGHLPGTRTDVINAAPREQLVEAIVAERFLYGKHTALCIKMASRAV
jgi:hypothetical protein